MSEKFNYTYSAAQRREIEEIRKKYSPAPSPLKEDRIAEIKKLDAKVTNTAAISALCVGIFSALVMGWGMSLVMTDLGKVLGIENTLLSGICTGLVGMAGVIAAYPLYKLVLKRQRKKAAPKILKLTEGLEGN